MGAEGGGRLLGDLMAGAPLPWPAEDLPVAIREAGRGARLVVLDDDPTGMQTMYGIPVVIRWDVATLVALLAQELPAIYLLTNSRSLPPAEAAQVNGEAMDAVLAAAAQLGVVLRIVSRSDSTLRGHFPLETDLVRDRLAAAGQPVSGLLLAPAFMEGGRYTIGGVHYVADDDRLIPAGETEFARDAAFGYRSSALPDWVAEKTGGAIPPEHVTVLTLDRIRSHGPNCAAALMRSVAPGGVVAVDGLAYRDLEVAALAMLQLEQEGRRFLVRSGASFVRALAGLTERPLLSPAEATAAGEGAGGLCVVGSYIQKSTEQLHRLLTLPGIEPVELDAGRVLEPGGAVRESDRAARQINAALRSGSDVVLYTSRDLIRRESPKQSLAVGRLVSEALTRAVARVSVRPRFLIAKGGITSHDVAARALGVRVALVLGQILPGVPVWQLGPETPFPGMPYVVFPGNVGGPDALRRVVAALRMRGKEEA